MITKLIEINNGNRMDMSKALTLATKIKTLYPQKNVEIHLNKNSGYIFACDEHGEMYMLNENNEVEKYYSCRHCGEEGFLYFFQEENDCSVCRGCLEIAENK